MNGPFKLNPLPAMSRTKSLPYVRSVAFAPLFLVTAGTATAVAEVCDKVVGGSWHPEDGAVWFPVVRAAPELVVVLGLAFVMSLVLGSRLMGYGVAILVLVAAAAESLVLLEDTVVLEPAIEEGCISMARSVTGIVVLVTASVVAFWLTGRNAARRSVLGGGAR